jgi:hypothetical protein
MRLTRVRYALGCETSSEPPWPSRWASAQPSPIAEARAFLAARFGGEWDGPCLMCGTNQVLVRFDPLVDPAGVVLWLKGVHVAVPGTGLGGRVLDALHDHADATGVPYSPALPSTAPTGSPTTGCTLADIPGSRACAPETAPVYAYVPTS